MSATGAATAAAPAAAKPADAKQSTASAASHPGAGPHTVARKVVLVSIDGWGVAPAGPGNAIHAAKTPNMDKLAKDHLYAELDASGLSVGLPPGVMGNSEVGHLTMGCGRVDFQDLVRINMSITEGTFASNPTLQAAFANATTRSHSRLHLLGLVSDGGVHSHINHVFEFLKAAKAAGIKDTYVHFFADGRDTPPSSGTKYLNQLLEFMSQLGYGKVATIMGRYYAMDRDKRWERIQVAYDALTDGIAPTVLSAAESASPAAAVKAVEVRYAQHKESDEFLKPIIVNKEGLIGDDETVIFFDYRSDRMRQIVETFGVKQHFTTTVKPRKNLSIYQMTQYNSSFPFPILYPPQSMANVLSEWVSKHGWFQFHTAETEKYAHVTFFFNGGREAAFEKEDRFLIASPKVATYDLAPEMSMTEVGNKVIEAMENKEREYPFIMCNLAAPDMVGHTGVYNATVVACEACDVVIGNIFTACQKNGYTLVITADHGNAEEMLDANGQPKTSHTTRLVPLIVAGDKKKLSGLSMARAVGGLKDVAPTVCHLLGVAVPKEMTGVSMLAAAAPAAVAAAPAKQNN